MRDVSSGHGRETTFHAEGENPVAPRGFRGGRSGRQANRDIAYFEGGTSRPSLLSIDLIERILLNMQLGIIPTNNFAYSIVNAVSNCDLIVLSIT